MSPAQNTDELLLTLQQILDQSLPGEAPLREALLRRAQSILDPQRNDSAASMDLFLLVSRMVDECWLRERVQPPEDHQRKAAILDHLGKAQIQLDGLRKDPGTAEYSTELSHIVARMRWDLTLARLDWLAQQQDTELSLGPARP